MNKLTKTLSALLLGSLVSTSVWSAAALSVSVTAPTGSASKDFSSKILKSMLYTPCLDAAAAAMPTTFGAVGAATGINVDNKFDQFTIKLSGTNSDDNADDIFDYDLYFFIVNVGASGSAADIANGQFYVFRRYDAFGAGVPGVEVALRATSTTLDPATDVLLRAADFSSATIDETILGGSIALDAFSLPQGTWLAVAILADSTDPLLDFDNPATWTKWDATPFILGAPWRTNGLTCD